ncbi:MAG: hypothetical protein JXQ29_18660 [Planctomycetes bacterium]|nr:hypothetical protein [Planctomycetota bacterium]
MAGEGMISGSSCLVKNDQYSNLKTFVARHTTVTAADTIICTGLGKVICVFASYDTDPADANLYVSATIGDQAGTPAAGSVIVKTWKTADGADPTPAAATAFSKIVTVIAFGY